MNTNTGEIRTFEAEQSIPNNYIKINKNVEGILSRFSRKERKHLWATYQILDLINKISFDDFVETLFKAYNYKKGFE